VSKKEVIGSCQAHPDQGFIDKIKRDDLEKMPEEVGKSVCVHIECKGQLGGNGQEDGPDHPFENIPVEFGSILEKQGNRGQKNNGDDIFTDLLKGGESDALDKAEREDVPIENGYEKKQKSQEVTRKQEIDFQFPSDE